MELIADILLLAGALGAGFYCFVLARRLKRFTDLEKGVGGAVAVLSSQADELKQSLDSARAASDQSGQDLRDLTQRAEAVAQRLELMMASMHDLAPSDTEAAIQPEADLPKVEPEIPMAEEDANEIDSQDAEHLDETPTKPPEGVMFLRHARPNGEAAT